MCDNILQKLDDLETSLSSRLQQITQKLKDKYNSTSKQINKSDIKDISTIIQLITCEIATMKEVAVQNQLNDTNQQLMTELTNIISTNKTRQQPSFAQIVKNTDHLNQQIHQKQKGIEEKTIIISANDDQSPTNILIQTNNAIKHTRNENRPFKINKIIKSKNGAIIKLPPEEDIDQLIKDFKEFDQLNNIASIYQPTPLDPTVVLKAISKITNIKELPEIICNMNPQLNGCEKKMQVLFAIKSNTDVQDVVLRVCPKVYETIMQTGQIYTDIQVARVKDRVFIRQCQKCFQFDHSSNQCKNQISCITCGAKGDHNCTKITRCQNCSSHPKYKNNTDHLPNNKECPLYSDQIKKLIQKTCYTGLDHEIKIISRKSTSNGI
ncbi:uncharacterized protein LOC142646342 [Dermatophagoides pteronyssinus]|uniref:uncharacterized protein LOC142646342 n=1 Tax=Dermatophagoides pteronyssinus TaxID=6956 RepID=UPI003F6738C0